ncbi:hypothetical protein BJ684DRAFT_19173 [Piptocephalis cylindrospora]|uniref:NAD(P)-binding protein n=1 Tax=Piptocephalis cylindrospora TaxID=1907219 RepID=A0A4P9Y801_9FUNG|nr:hypothetical protein BJ684DRAFT_19173 [Piptocephalis cylindrospora]|eukprot:RKP14421.1 hypothetical protein BJ684DRAFT_19173 [Piptocephalis cylindrospora]
MISGEGFNAEHVFLVLRHTLGSWVFTSVLYASLRVAGWYTSPVYKPLMAYTALLVVHSAWKRYQRKKVKPLDYSEEVVLITGGSGGMGWSLAQILAMQGADVITLDHREAPSRHERNISSYLCDLTDSSQIEQISQRIRKKHGAVTILINNAAITKPALLTEVTEEGLLREFKVNVIAPSMMIRAFLPDMLHANHGHIITIGSVLGATGFAYGAGYCSSKAALSRLHESLSQELQHIHTTSKVHASYIIPAHINTPMFSQIGQASPLATFFLPMAQSFEVARDVVRVIDAQNSTTLYLPTMSRFSLLYPLFPTWLLNVFHWASNSTLAFKSMMPPEDQKAHTQ